jgi:isoquinoline 1-oxidoreductase beta subunit
MTDRALLLVPRRSFLAAVGLSVAGLSLGVTSHAAPPARTPDGLRPNAFLHVAPDGKVTIVCHRSEMGQGVRSTLPVILADELGADTARVTVVQADGDETYGDQNTDGSHSVRGHYDDLRRLGATARVMLIEAAAKRWGVPATACEARDHAVHHAKSKRTLGFGELANEAARVPIPKKEDVPLRPRSELAHLGKTLPLLDAPAIVTGRAVFGADVRLPGMLTAIVARPPAVGGKVVRYDATKALAVPGVKSVLPLPAPSPPFAFQPLGGLAVLADTTWAAMRGRAALDVTWDPGPNATYDTASYDDYLARSVNAPGTVVRSVGAEAAPPSGGRGLTSLYQTPHLAHAPMEPPVALAKVDGERCEIWAPTQNPQSARAEVAKALGIPKEHVTVHVTLLGGGFGRKSKPDYVVEAALLARAAGAPVRVQWTREDDIRHDYYHSTSAQLLRADLDERGRVVAWHHRIAFPPIGATFRPATYADTGELQQGVLDLPLAVPSVRVENCEAQAHVRIGWLRSVANIYHCFAVQSFVGELAHLRGTDPRDTLLELLGPARVVTPVELGVPKLPNYGQSLDEHPVDVGRLRRVIERVAELARWNERTRDGRALGLAAHRSFLTYVAVVASVVRDARYGVRVDDAWIVADAGTVVNTERARAQLEGAVVFGTSLALHGAITMKGGATEQANFHDYRMARMPEVPREIHVEILPSEGPPGGIGEPGVPPVAPAIANAVFARTGTRVRQLPILRALRG